MTLNWLKALTITKIPGLFLLVLLSFSLTHPLLAQDIDLELVKKGKDLFKGNCAACHHPTKDMTGPALFGITEKWESCASDFKGKTGKEWLYEWIKNYQTALDAEVPCATDIEGFSPAAMIPFLSLSDDDIDAILYYSDNSTAGQEAVVAVNEDEAKAEEEEDARIVNWFLGFLVLALLIVAFVLAKVSDKLKAAANEKAGIIEEDSVTFFKSSLFKTLITLTIMVFVFYGLSSQAIALGRQQGYQPMQPIKFSHALHAGENEIDCNFCHTGAVEGKHSNIPSPNMCMNCHKMIKEGPEHGRKEIAKIYSAIGFNPMRSTYFDLDNISEEEYTEAFKKFLSKDEDYTEADLEAVIKMFNKPIEWVRIHNLPDHVYFNHSQHVVAGNVECESCHGDVGNMEVVKQHSSLSMGWCINCHRETEIDLGNEYYKDFDRLHKGATVEDIGGTDCQKCHY